MSVFSVYSPWLIEYLIASKHSSSSERLKNYLGSQDPRSTFGVWDMQIDKKKEGLVSVSRDRGKHGNMGHQKERIEGDRNSLGRVELQ